MSDVFDDKNFGEDSEMASMTIDWGMVGDSILGTFVKARHGIETQFGVNSIYEILGEKGEYHELVGTGRNAKPKEKATPIEKGQTYAVWGRGDIFVGQMNSLRPGQVIKLTYAEDKSTKMGTAKIVKIYAPKDNEGKPMMNQEWLDTQGVAAGDM